MTLATETERRVPLNRERVLMAALRLADDGGIESLSMRKLGQALGVEAMSLYNHVANKDDLINGIIDLVLEEFELPSGEDDWESAVRQCAISAHEALLHHPWACNLIMSSTRLRPARLQYLESLLRQLRQAGFSAEEASHAYHALDSHILGFTLWQLGHLVPEDMPSPRNKEELAIFFARLLPGFSINDYPYLLEHAMQHHIVASRPKQSEGEFEFGLRLILDGLKRLRSAS